MRRYFATVIVTATAVFCALLFVATLVPDSPYLRYQLFKHIFPGEAQWIYERIHFDNRALDVVVVGSSNADYGISAVRMAEDLSRRDLSVGVANFSMIVGGRNLNYTFVKEMFDAGRQPKLLVLGVTWRPAHFGHPAFKYLAEASEVFDAIYPINLNYLIDLSYLPYRKLKVIAAGRFPDVFDVKLRFDSSTYEGSGYDPPVMVRQSDGKIVDIRQYTMPRAELLNDMARTESGLHQIRLPAEMTSLEFGDEYFYVRKIVALAQAHGTKVAFLYIPSFQGPTKSLLEAFYGQYGPVFNADFISDNDQMFADAIHLNHDGALRISDWFADRVASLIGANTVTGVKNKVLQ